MLERYPSIYNILLQTRCLLLTQFTMAFSLAVTDIIGRRFGPIKRKSWAGSISMWILDFIRVLRVICLRDFFFLFYPYFFYLV
ncbi:hypothetical protein IMY05_008G0021900 [Salix suchowensis]|nr:hypothetical protein IMY05_008G0021900 [Salix suchowensis]